jgi:hypothetical protein
MFESPPNSPSGPQTGHRPARFRLDPWAADFGSAIGFEEGDEEDEERASSDVAVDVETDDWARGLDPSPSAEPERIVFVDGVQRTEAWGRFETGTGIIDAALASVAVGASICRGREAEIEFEPPARVLAVSGAFSVQPLIIQTRGPELRFEPSNSETFGRKGVSDAISKRRGELERRFAEKLVGRDSLVVLDGRLSFDPSGAERVVGLAKTIHRPYLQGPEWQLVGRLGPGQRTPVFRIKYGTTTRYSWYLRLPFTRPIHHSLAGIVRLETPEIGVQAAVDLADLTAYHLPRFASRPEHDPRAPQNLLPIGALEKRLRHEMGEQRWIRRLIEDHLHKEALHDG